MVGLIVGGDFGVLEPEPIEILCLFGTKIIINNII